MKKLRNWYNILNKHGLVDLEVEEEAETEEAESAEATEAKSAE